jgi:hypothetical protein
MELTKATGKVAAAAVATAGAKTCDILSAKGLRYRLSLADIPERNKTMITVETLRDVETDDLIGYYAFGHHTPETFIAAVRWSHDEQFQAEPGQIKHLHCVKRPLGPADPGETDAGYYKLVAVTETAKDALPVTVFGWD